MRLPSRGFLATLGGVALTLLAWYGPWAWPAWPAFAVMRFILGDAGFVDLPYSERAAWIVVLIVVNVGTWALLLGFAVSVWGRVRHGNAGGPHPADESGTLEGH